MEQELKLLNDALRVLQDLLEWDAYLGGHEARAWRRARKLVECIRSARGDLAAAVDAAAIPTSLRERIDDALRGCDALMAALEGDGQTWTPQRAEVDALLAELALRRPSAAATINGVTLSDRELAHVLAALRDGQHRTRPGLRWADTEPASEIFEGVAGGPLAPAEMDALCERLNGGPSAANPAPSRPIIVNVSGGLVQGIDGIPAGITVEVRDFDHGTGDEEDEEHFSHTADGERYLATRYTHDEWGDAPVVDERRSFE